MCGCSASLELIRTTNLLPGVLWISRRTSVTVGSAEFADSSINPCWSMTSIFSLHNHLLPDPRIHWRGTSGKLQGGIQKNWAFESKNPVGSNRWWCKHCYHCRKQLLQQASGVCLTLLIPQWNCSGHGLLKERDMRGTRVANVCDGTLSTEYKGLHCKQHWHSCT